MAAKLVKLIIFIFALIKVSPKINQNLPGNENKSVCYSLFNHYPS